MESASKVKASPSALGELTAKIRQGDEESFQQFHSLYFDRLFRYLLVVHFGDEASALDSLQETLLRVARKCRRFDSEETFWKWLTVVARSAARDQGRRQTRHLMALRRLFDAQPEEVGGAPLDAQEGDVRLHRLLDEGLAWLEPQDRQLIEAKYFESATVAGLAERSGLSRKAVESRLHRARQWLKQFIQEKLKA